jgi:hypothetical protein
MSHGFNHFATITKHRHQVIRNASHMGIFFHALRHDLTKYGYTEFHWSKQFYNGHCSPVLGERKAHDNFSFICQHHTRRNPHHWEYWTDFYMGKLVLCTMPYKWAVEYVCDMLAASKVYGGKAFKKDIPVAYFRDHAKHYYMTEATRQFIDWCLANYATSGWAHLHKKETLAKYREITAKLPRFETLSELHPTEELPNC